MANNTTMIELDEKDSCIVIHDNGEVSIHIPKQEEDEILLPSSARVYEILTLLFGDP